MLLHILHLIIISGISIASAATQTFSNTQQWGASEVYFMDHYHSALGLPKEKIELITPPPQGSLQEEKELSELIQLVGDRNEATKSAIESEKHFCGFNWPGYTFGNNRSLDEFIAIANYDVSAIIFKLKKKFDRVRPSFINPKIKPTITLPPHPAFPSAHAGQSMIAALILGFIYPEHKGYFLLRAKSIGHNREIAGVHYKSDTIAGQKVAQLYMDQLLKTPAKLQQLQFLILTKKPLNEPLGLITCREALSYYYEKLINKDKLINQIKENK